MQIVRSSNDVQLENWAFLVQYFDKTELRDLKSWLKDNIARYVWKNLDITAIGKKPNDKWGTISFVRLTFSSKTDAATFKLFWSEFF